MSFCHTTPDNEGWDAALGPPYNNHDKKGWFTDTAQDFSRMEKYSDAELMK